MSGLADVLHEVLDVDVEGDGALTVRYEDTVASLRTVPIAESLAMVSLNQALAWDLPNTLGLRERVAALAHTTMLGTVTMVDHGESADVMLRYNFPAGIEDLAMKTLVVLTLAGGAEVRRELMG